MLTKDDSGGSTSRRDPPTRLFHRLLVAVALSLAVTTLAATADDKHHEARQGIAADDVAPLERLFARIRREFGGQVLKVELDREDDGARWVYEAKVLTAAGSVLKLDYDAKSLELLQMKGHYGRDHEDDND